MPSAAHITPHADSLIELLVAQCADLEALLSLARQQEAAATGGDFAEIMRLVGERATLGERLEIYHRQVAEVRARVGANAESVLRGETAQRAVKLVTDIQAQDARTRPLLAAARDEASDSLTRLDRTRRTANAYARAPQRAASVACDQRI